MRTLISYLYSRRRIIAVGTLIGAVFTVLLILYGVPTAAAAYAALVCGAIILTTAAWDLFHFAKKLRALKELQSEILLTLEHLPEADDDVENGYHQLLETLFIEKNALASAADKRCEDLSDYFAMWAHQIKTPITAMSLALQSSDFTEKEGEVSENLQKIEQYVEMALCYVHLDNDDSDLVIKKHLLDNIVKQAVRKYSGQFIRRKLTLVYEPMNVDVLTDEKLLLFVIEQVISNALKYTPRGKVEIKLERPAEPILLIRDTGIGIAPEDLPRVFERGFTGNNGRSDKRATGIGLYLCRRICTKLGHTISAQSDENGTEIRIDLRVSGIDTRE